MNKNYSALIKASHWKDIAWLHFVTGVKSSPKLLCDRQTVCTEEEAKDAGTCPSIQSLTLQMPGSDKRCFRDI